MAKVFILPPYFMLSCVVALQNLEKRSSSKNSPLTNFLIAYNSKNTKYTDFGTTLAVQFRDMIGGATFIISLVCSLLYLLFSSKMKKEKVMPMLITETINQIKTIVPIVTFVGWVAYIGIVIQSWLVTGVLSIHN
ncbi:hypothetical protein ACN23B_18210 [Anabaena sp. FACHB-709]|nr:MULTISPECIES: hypothetical protein [Nostocaceae]MBD2175199.1 hypothetical protein [Anabaena cylindrica FACHB-318]MBD2267074.1 hypothetical protein [Anabaena sp. FACHB-709]MBD2276642.1 hypothetical protein [Nostoc sp. PCC 7120 = FACHB-418]MBD2287186.1 hypothetical protein [Anabaena cylindrica FACHB-170]MBD2352883.1 hypothetical protein [Trichormus variabilis FACHB-171]